jgi:pimeloyl-ACP methyl ester carboxylesterase
MRDVIHFAHGNGFPALCYKQLLDRLAVRFDCLYVDRIGHNPSYPVGDNWVNLVAQVLASVKSQTNKPVIALGHSLGGVLSLLAAIEEPSLFKAVIMLDSPLIGPVKSNMVRLAKALGVIDRITPAFRTKDRREHWQDKEQLVRYLKTRELFETFTDECLNDYITYGLEQKPDGYYLRFDRHIEYQIYRTIPHTIPKLKGKLIIPTRLIYGDKSTVVDRMDRHYMRTYFDIKCYKVKGAHLFPMENPQTVAEQVFYAIDSID